MIDSTTKGGNASTCVLASDVCTHQPNRYTFYYFRSYFQPIWFCYFILTLNSGAEWHPNIESAWIIYIPLFPFTHPYIRGNYIAYDGCDFYVSNNIANPPMSLDVEWELANTEWLKWLEWLWIWNKTRTFPAFHAYTLRRNMSIFSLRIIASFFLFYGHCSIDITEY